MAHIPELARAEARLPRWMAAVAIAGLLVTLLAGRPQAALAFGLGAGLAILNYFWLHQAVETLLGARHTRLPKRVVMKFTVRYPLALGGVYLFYRTGWLPIGAVLAGFFVPVAGVVIEAIFQIREGLRM